MGSTQPNALNLQLQAFSQCGKFVYIRLLSVTRLFEHSPFDIKVDIFSVLWYSMLL